MATLNSTTIPSRRAAIAAGLRGAMLLAIGPAAVAQPAVTAGETPTLPAAAGNFDFLGTLARWRGARAKVRAAIERVDAIEFSWPPMPQALRVGPDDRPELRDLERIDYDEHDQPVFAGVYDRDAADAIRGWKEEGAYDWPLRDGGNPYLRKWRERAEEVLAAFDAWKEERDRTHRASGIPEGEDAISEAMHEEKDLASEAIRAPACAEAIALKLQMFADYWREEHPGQAGIDDFEHSPATRQAIAVAVDLLALTRRAGDDDGSAPDSFRSLGEVAATVMASLPQPNARAAA